jgi:dihydrofolate synthase/folylpolyglutamate synthase
MGQGPWLVIDGAHNTASAEALACTLRENFPAGPRTLVFGTSRDKDLPGQLSALLPVSDRVIATRYLENPRAVAPGEIVEVARGLGFGDVEVAPSPREALRRAYESTPRDGLICVTGSLFLAAESRRVVLEAGRDGREGA